jgi:hypothetical protein
MNAPKTYFIEAENLHSGRNYSTIITAKDEAEARAKFRAWDSGYLIDRVTEVVWDDNCKCYVHALSSLTPTTPNFENTEIAGLVRMSDAAWAEAAFKQDWAN